MWGSRGIGGRPQDPLQDDEGCEDDCGYSDDTNGTVNVAHDANSPYRRYLRPRFGRRCAPSAGKYFSANLPSRLRSGPPQLRQSNSRSCSGGDSARTNLYGASQVGQWNATAFSKGIVLAMMMPPTAFNRGKGGRAIPQSRYWVGFFRFL